MSRERYGLLFFSLKDPFESKNDHFPHPSPPCIADEMRDEKDPDNSRLAQIRLFTIQEVQRPEGVKLNCDNGKQDKFTDFEVSDCPLINFLNPTNLEKVFHECPVRFSAVVNDHIGGVADQ